jgi:hypothetical protein
MARGRDDFALADHVVDEKVSISYVESVRTYEFNVMVEFP